MISLRRFGRLTARALGGAVCAVARLRKRCAELVRHRRVQRAARLCRAGIAPVWSITAIAPITTVAAFTTAPAAFTARSRLAILPLRTWPARALATGATTAAAIAPVATAAAAGPGCAVRSAGVGPRRLTSLLALSGMRTAITGPTVAAWATFTTGTRAATATLRGLLLAGRSSLPGLLRATLGRSAVRTRALAPTLTLGAPLAMSLLALALAPSLPLALALSCSALAGLTLPAMTLSLTLSLPLAALTTGSPVMLAFAAAASRAGALGIAAPRSCRGCLAPLVGQLQLPLAVKHRFDQGRLLAIAKGELRPISVKPAHLFQ